VSPTQPRQTRDCSAPNRSRPSFRAEDTEISQRRQ